MPCLCIANFVATCSIRGTKSAAASACGAIRVEFGGVDIDSIEIVTDPCVLFVGGNFQRKGLASPDRRQHEDT